MRRELGMSVALVVMCLGLFISNPDFLGQSNVDQHAPADLDARHLRDRHRLRDHHRRHRSVDRLGHRADRRADRQAVVAGTGGLGYSLWVGIPVALGVALSLGCSRGCLITRLRLQPFIVTLGGMLLIRGVSQTIVEGGTLSLGGSPLLELVQRRLPRVGGDPLLPYPLLIFLVVVGIATYVLHFTVFGRYVYAIGGNRDAAEYSGINVRRIETITYVISAGLAGVAGVCYAAYIGQMSQQVGIAYELYAIAAAVLGGCSLRGGEGTVLGIIIGSAVMRVIDNGINMFQVRYVDHDRSADLAARPELDVRHHRRGDPASPSSSTRSCTSSRRSGEFAWPARGAHAASPRSARAQEVAAETRPDTRRYVLAAEER